MFKFLPFYMISDNFIFCPGSSMRDFNPCNSTTKAAKNTFSLPVIISDDGGSAGSFRSQASVVQNWASQTLGRGGSGVFSYDHIDGDKMTNIPSNCTTYSDTCVHCGNLDAIGDDSPRCLGITCGVATTDTNYCGCDSSGNNCLNSIYPEN